MGRVETHAELTVGGGSIRLRHAELNALLASLASLGGPDAASISEEIAALRVAGVRIDLRPSEAELDALRRAISATGASRPVPAALSRLRTFCV